MDLPYYIDHLVEQLPPGHLYSAQLFLERHTHLPLYAPFLPSARLQQVEHDMRGTSNQAQSRLGLSASQRRSLRYLRFCPQCVANDRHHFGETYWHRIHQIPGVEVCAIHAVWLQNSSAPANNLVRYVAAEAVITNEPPVVIDKRSFPDQVFLHIAQNAAWLLANPTSWDDDMALFQRLRMLLHTEGYLTRLGKAHSARLKYAIAETYSPELLSRLQCKFDVRMRKPWIVRLVQSSKEVQQPIGYLLLFHFFGYTVEEVFGLSPTLPHPFGEPPWLCLNPVCPDYHQPVISSCEVKTSFRGHPQGIFTCLRCGFSYLRTGPDTQPEDRLRRTVVKDYGKLWEERLATYWYDSSLSLRTIAGRLGINRTPIRRQALRLGLDFPRTPTKRESRLPEVYRTSQRRFPDDEETLRQDYRATWLAARKEHPDWGRTQLGNAYMQAWIWLYRYDREWIDQHQPPLKRGVGDTSRIDWAARDARLAVAVEAAAQRLYQQERRPVRVSLSAIGREIHALTQLRSSLHKLPKTAEVLARVVETPPACAIRRIQWVARCYREEGTFPRRHYQLMARSGVHSLMDHPDVKAVFEETFFALQE